jgi:hypothetical protein
MRNRMHSPNIKTFECLRLSTRIWSIWLWVFPSGDVQVYLWMLRCGNIVLLTLNNILIRWKKYFLQSLNEHSINDVRQVEIHTAETLVPDYGLSDDGFAVLGWKGINRQRVIKSRQNSFKQGVKYYDLRSKSSLILLGIRKNCLKSW